MLLAGKEAEMICLMPDEALGREATDDMDVFGAYSGTDGTPHPPADPNTITRGQAMSNNSSEGWFTWAAGSVGSNVTGVTVHTSSGPDVEASVVGNRFVAWWPGDGESWSYTVHLADRSSRRVS